MVYGYLRVSTDQQDEHNQKVGVDLKAKELGVNIDKYVIDHMSGTTDPKQRNLGKLLNKLKTGDILIISELSRLSRRLFMLFRVLENLLNKDIKVYSVKDGYSLDNSLQSKVIAFAFGMAAEIERDMISQRTKEALALRKEQGVHLGRPFGSKTRVHKLDTYKTRLEKWYNNNMSKSRMARNCRVSIKTLRKYLKNNLNLPDRPIDLARTPGFRTKITTA